MIIPKLGKITWTCITGIAIVVGTITAIWKVDDRYAKAEELKNSIMHVEQQTVQTFEAMQKTLQIQLYDLKEDSLDDRYLRLRLEHQKFPEDMFIKEELDAVEQKRIEIKKKKEELLGN